MLSPFRSGFVAKLMYTKKAESNESKLFLNIVYSEQVDEPTVNNSDSNGCNWSIPFALGPVRLEADKQNNLVSTFDCCFHPLSLRHAHSRTEFLDLLINVAKDAVGTTFKMSGDEVEMAEGYTLLRGVKYKSGTTPKALLVGTEDPAPSSKETKANVQRKDPTLPEPVSAGGNSTKDNDGKPITPKYHLAEQGVFDIGEYTTQTHAPASRRPRQLVVRVFVDEAKSAADVNLDVSPSILKIAPSSKCMYELEVKLPYPVNSQKGNARFDAKKKTLVVTLPVVA